jgi:uncharacterized membrane protein YeaQ/YmgE (transglycosylase-associated protein family)
LDVLDILIVSYFFILFASINKLNQRWYMDPNTINLIISLISGILGGNIAGSLLSERNIGAIANTISGLVGGGITGWILKALGVIAVATYAGHTGAAPAAAAPASSFDLGSLLANIGGSGVGGGILAWIVTLIKEATQKPS